MAFDRLKVKEFKLRDPIDARQADQAIQELNRTVNRFPIIQGNEEPEGFLTAPPGTIYSLNQSGAGSLYLKASGESTTGWKELARDNNDFIEKIYSGGNIDLGLTNQGAFTDVDSVNASITFNVSKPGVYKVEFDFPYTINLGATTNGAGVDFQFTDGVTTKFAGYFANNRANSYEVTHASFSATFPYSAAAAVTVRLRKQVTVTVGTTVNVHFIESNNNLGRALTIRAYRISS